MPSHAELSSQMLKDAAQFFITVGEQNAPLQDQMTEHARVFEQIAGLVEFNPTGVIAEGEGAEGAIPVASNDGAETPQITHAQLAARLLRVAAEFFMTVGQQNSAMEQQMTEHATAYQQVATLIEHDPHGVIEDPAGEEAPPTDN